MMLCETAESKGLMFAMMGESIDWQMASHNIKGSYANCYWKEL
jgi:hypothetical protein